MNRDIVDDVRHGAHVALEKTEATAESAKLGVLDAIGRVSEIFRTIRAFGLDDLLRPVGLQRRQSPVLAVSMFGVGLATGTAVGMMLAPSSGRQSRRAIGRWISNLLDKSEEGLSTAVSAAKDVAKDTVNEAKEAVTEAKGIAKDAATEAKGIAKDAVTEAKGIAKNAVTEAKGAAKGVASSLEHGLDSLKSSTSRDGELHLTTPHNGRSS